MRTSEPCRTEATVPESGPDPLAAGGGGSCARRTGDVPVSVAGGVVGAAVTEVAVAVAASNGGSNGVGLAEGAWAGAGLRPWIVAQAASELRSPAAANAKRRPHFGV
jgi:hypothetical protein